MNQPLSTAHENFEGNMFLYAQPQLLTVEDHGHLGLNTSGQTYDFVRSIRVVPLAAAELSSAQKHYPVIFSDLEKPTPLAVVGVLEDRNLFVDDNGNWDSAAYVPSYLRCYPFAMASRQDDQYAVVIDRAAPVISVRTNSPTPSTSFAGHSITNSSWTVNSRAAFGCSAASRRSTAIIAFLSRSAAVPWMRALIAIRLAFSRTA